MKVLMINGSRREKGCTYTAMTIIAKELKDAGIDAEIAFVGRDAVNGNLPALVASLKEKCASADGFVFGSPVYYASPTGEIEVVLDRLFGVAGKELAHKPAAVITSARRAGTTATLDALAKYPCINQMPLVTSSYWPMVHGNTPEEVLQDGEGVAVMKNLGRNMAWMLRCLEAGRKAGVEVPEGVAYSKTNFIR